MRRLRKRAWRAGAILVLTAAMMVLMFAFLALAVDMGYMMLVRTQLQSAADSAALAATVEMLTERMSPTRPSLSDLTNDAEAAVREYAGGNVIAGDTSTTVAGSDITFGRVDLTLGYNQDGDGASFTDTITQPNDNAVRVYLRRSANQGGEVPMFFARVVGFSDFGSEAMAVAAYSDNIQGFNPPSEGQPNLDILPITLDKQTWDQLKDQLLAGNTGDSWTWNEGTGQVSSGSDGVREANLYPQGTGSPGNRGTVDVGNPNNSTADLSRQIREGVTAEDLSYLPGGKLELGPDGTTQLNGDTGMSSGIKDDLSSIIGQTRVIPIFSSVAGNGNNAQYTIVGFAGVRVMAVKLTGNPSGRYVTIQPANVQVGNVIPGPDTGEYSWNIFSKHVWLLR